MPCWLHRQDIQAAGEHRYEAAQVVDSLTPQAKIHADDDAMLRRGCAYPQELGKRGFTSAMAVMSQPSGSSGLQQSIKVLIKLVHTQSAAQHSSTPTEAGASVDRLLMPPSFACELYPRRTGAARPQVQSDLE